MSTSISAIICTHNRSAILSRTLESLSRVRVPEGARAEVVVVANACTDDTAEMARAWGERMAMPLRVVEEPTPGLSIARNRGAKEASNDVLAFLDDDIWASEGWLESMLDTFESTNADMVAGHIVLWYEEAKPGWITPGMEVMLSCLDLGDKVCGCREAIGANFACTKRVFERAGPFRPELGRTGNVLLAGDETYFVRLALAQGVRMYYSPGASVKHWVPRSRVDPVYLAKVSRSSAYTLTVMTDTFGIRQTIASIGVGAGRYLGHSVALPLWRLVGDTTRANRAVVRRAIGLGRVQGGLRRLRDDSLVPERAARASLRF